MACLCGFSSTFGDMLTVLLCFRSPLGFGDFTELVLTCVVSVVVWFLLKIK